MRGVVYLFVCISYPKDITNVFTLPLLEKSGLHLLQ